MSLLKNIYTFLQIVVLLAFTISGYLLTTPQRTYAQEDCSEQRLRNLGLIVVNCEGANRCAVPSADTPRSAPAAGSSVYVIGDSITYGMVTSGQLLTKIGGAGYAISTDITDSGSPRYEVTGPSVAARSGRPLDWGTERVRLNSEAVAASDVVMVALGTNNIAQVVQNDGGGVLPNGLETITTAVTELVAAVRSVNTTATIYWTNVYVAGTLRTEFGTFNMDLAMPVINQAIESVGARDENFNIIPWATSSEAPNLVPNVEDDGRGDGIHPSGNYPEMADYIVEQLSNSSSAAQPATGLAGCACSQSNPIVTDGTTAENYRSAWDYLVGVIGLSDEAAAGVMGNLEVESGGTMDPQVVQFSANFPGDRSPELPLAEIEGRFGYGIAQWTFPSRQRNLIAFAAETNRSTGSLDLQLDFLFKELSESYRTALAVLETPGVTTAQASDVILLEFETPAKVILPPRGSSTEAGRQEEIDNRRGRSETIYATYAGTGGVYSGASCASSPSGDVAIDLDAVDTSSVECASGTTVVEARIDAYNKGEQFVIRTCSYGGFVVNSQLSGPIKGLLDRAEADGIAFTSSGTFRSMQEQIDNYVNDCESAGIEPTREPYPKDSYSDYVSCPTFGPPGFSNHQMGLAIDFGCNGATIPRAYATAQSNQCFQWLLANAGSYGLVEYGRGENREGGRYEAWHWSADGT